MTEEDRTFRTIETGPIVKDKKIIGHHFYEGELQYFGIDDEEGLSSGTDWYIYPDGTFCYTESRSWESWDIDGDGTFDSSKYGEFVDQMMHFIKDWKDELEPNLWDYEEEEGESEELSEIEQGEREEVVVEGSITEMTPDGLPF